MNSMNARNSFLRHLLLLVLMAAIPVYAGAQKKTDSSKPAKSSAPAKPSTPAQHSTGTSHSPSSTAGHGTANAPGHGTANTAGHNTTGTPNASHGPTGAGAGRGTANAAHGPSGNPKTTPAGVHERQLNGGGTASVRKDGSVRSINKNGMQIQRGLHGGRTVVSTRNGARVVSTRHGGYVQRSYYSRGGRTYVSRTYVVRGVTYTNVYRSYSYGGYCCYYGYAPAYYYGPAYYGWAYNPWPGPVYYGWGWGGAPWYGYYGPYWAPYPAYPSAAFWITDWMVAASLQAAYAEQAAEAGALVNPLGPDLPLIATLGPVPAPENAKVALSKEVKDLLAEEVKAQIAEDQAAAGKSGGTSSGQASGGQAASNEPLPSLDPKRRTFVVHNELSVVADGEECALTEGDVISRVSDTPDADKNVDVKVLASKKTDCAIGKQVAVSLDDLQEMHNHFREQLQGGLDELSKKQGTGGLPKSPDTKKQDGEVTAPPADSSAAKALQDQQSAADQTEAEVKQEAGSGTR